MRSTSVTVRFIAAAFGDLPASALFPDYVKAWIQAIKAEGRAPKDTLKLKSYRSSLCEFAVEVGAADANPVKVLRRGVAPKNQPVDWDPAARVASTLERSNRPFQTSREGNSTGFEPVIAGDSQRVARRVRPVPVFRNRPPASEREVHDRLRGVARKRGPRATHAGRVLVTQVHDNISTPDLIGQTDRSTVCLRLVEQVARPSPRAQAAGDLLVQYPGRFQTDHFGVGTQNEMWLAGVFVVP